jgi:hypothetical protein
MKSNGFHLIVFFIPLPHPIKEINLTTLIALHSANYNAFSVVVRMKFHKQRLIS